MNNEPLLKALIYILTQIQIGLASWLVAIASSNNAWGGACFVSFQALDAVIGRHSK